MGVEKILRCNTFSLYGHIGHALGPEPLTQMNFTIPAKGFMDLKKMHFSFSQIYMGIVKKIFQD